MSLFKRNRIWWADFSVNGVRYRLSLGTTDWREAGCLEKEHIARACQGKLSASGEQFARLAFVEAAKQYVESRKVELTPGSLAKERELLRGPSLYFDNTPLRRIGVEDLRAYRRERAEEGRAAVYINMEMGAIRRLLKRAKRWHLFEDNIKPLREQHREVHVLSPEEKDRLAKIAASRPDWQTARLGILLCLNTTMRGCEIRGLRWCDIDFAKRLLTVRHSKTEAGERAIPLNQNAWAAVQEQGELAVALFGEVRPEWFIFPRGEGCLARPDPTQPMKGWRTAWRSMTRAIECPSCGLFQKPTEFCRNEECRAILSGLKSPLAGLRFHDLRHHAITELAESEASEQTILGIAGHVSPRMLRHYSHVRLEAKRKALDALSKGGSEQSDMPKDVPSHSPDPSTPPHTIDKSVTCAPIQPTINNAVASPKPEPLYEETVRIKRISMVGEKLLYTQKEAARMLSISVRMLSYMISSGQLAARRIGRRVLISGDALVEFAQSDHVSGKRVSSPDMEIE